jgi:hypothetical protein
MLATTLQVSADASSADKRAHIRDFTKSLTKDLKDDQLTYKHTGIKDVSHTLHARLMTQHSKQQQYLAGSTVCAYHCCNCTA